MGSGSIIHGPSSGEKFIGNVWWSAGREITFREYKDLAKWSSATGQEKLNGLTAGKQIDPKLKGPFITTLTDPYKLNLLDGYFLLSNSPLKNMGLNLKILFNIPFAPHDFFGHSVPMGSNPEPGIYELKE